MTPFNFLDLDRFSRGTPFDAFMRLQRECPVYWHPMKTHRTGDGFWLLTKHRDICEVSKNPGLFYSNDGSVLTDAPARNSPPALMMVRDGLNHLDPPDHAFHRQFLAPLFTARGIAPLEPRVRQCVARILDRACELEEFDLVEEVATRLPVEVVFGNVLGFEPHALARAAYWADLFNRSHAIPVDDPEFGHVRQEAAVALEELHACALEVFRARRVSPGADVLSALAHALTPDGHPISEDVFVRCFWSLMIGAFDTTASTIAGGLLALEMFPAQRIKLEENPQLVAAAVEEMLRWVSPVIYFRRTAGARTEIRGQQIARGDRIVLCYAAANRDAEVFDAPTVFDISRQPNEHLAFGHGPHFCLGAMLARMELRLLVDELIRRHIRVSSVGPITRARSNFINRITHMPVRTAVSH
jgi:cholest-4-en-3-one 26-monooxygenase